MDFWSHVVQGSELGRQISTSVLAFNWSSKPKVSNFQNEVLVQQEVLWFEVSVSNALSMAEVQALKQLLEVVPGDLLAELSRVGNEVKEFSSLSEFEHDVADFLVDSVVLFVDSLSGLNLLYDIDVFQTLHGVDFVEDKLFHAMVHVVVHDLDGALSSGREVLGQLDFAAGSFAQLAEDLEVT